MNKVHFNRNDWLCALIAGFISLALYAWTAAPNVTLLDSGEFIVAAQHFGVPHPTGYPLWTILSWLFLLLPLGNPAWEIAIFSAVCGALAVGLAALISSHAIRWIFPDSKPAIAFVASLTFSLLLAFSVSMWSQATIAEVYTLHALTIGLILLTLYRFLHDPESDGNIIACFFFLALSFSNHHLTLTMIPLPYLAVLLLRREIIFDLIILSLLTATLFLMGYASLSGDAALIKTSLRFTWCCLGALGILLCVRKGDVEWKLLAFLPIAVALGLLPYLYMPIASSTNPPMNWGYTSEKDGFYYSVNRSQYNGPLSSQIQKTLGVLMGTVKKEETVENKENSAPRFISMAQLPLKVRAQQWIGFFWLQLNQSFTPLCVFAFFGAFFSILRLPLAQRCWVYLLNLAFILAAFLQPLMDAAETSADGWWLQMPYHTYTNFIFALLCSLGFAFLWIKLSRRLPKISPVLWLFLILPLSQIRPNYDVCSQRNRWFGWMFGHDMLKDLPKNSVVFGGTDPGRFVPTYMILGESGLPAKWKRDPDFDRRDLYIITQNALGDDFYNKYIGDHYGVNRPQAKNDFERWLGREKQYPATPLQLPTLDEINKEAQKMSAKAMEENPTAQPDLNAVYHGAAAKWIFEHNKKDHAFFVEESFPMEWSYPYATPEGLIYRINSEPVPSLSKEIVKKDFDYWDDYIRKLLSNPEYEKDFDAKRSFSKLRVTMGRIYHFRKMEKEAETALRQALTLWSGNQEAILLLSSILWDHEEYEEPVKLLNNALNNDPYDLALIQLFETAQNRKKLQTQIKASEAILEKNPKDRETFKKLMDDYARVADSNRLTTLMQDAKKNFNEDSEILQRIAQFYYQVTNIPAAVQTIETLTKLEPNDPRHWYELARMQTFSSNAPAAVKSTEQAISKGGLEYRERINSDPAFNSIRTNADFQKLVNPPGVTLPNPPPHR